MWKRFSTHFAEHRRFRAEIAGQLFCNSSPAGPGVKFLYTPREYCYGFIKINGTSTAETFLIQDNDHVQKKRPDPGAGILKTG